VPLTVSDGRVNGAAAPGAERLEGPASEDVYRFPVAVAEQLLTVRPTSYPGTFYLRWWLIDDATGASVDPGTARSGTCNR
jgi:hypothetical protein